MTAARTLPETLTTLTDDEFDAIRIAWTRLLVDLTVIEAQTRVAVALAVLDGLVTR